MRKLLLKSNLCVALALGASLSAYALPTNFFPQHSLLADGYWVKVTTAEAGVYAITHEQLRQMGFSDPAAVRVYGHGARPMSTQFANSSNEPLIAGDMEQVAVMYEADRILFYAQGPDIITWNGDAESPYFSRDTRNIYSDTGAYFLSEKGEALTIEPACEIDPEAALTNRVTAYLHHEEDLYQGRENTGQLFWEHSFTKAQPSRQWSLSLPRAVVGTRVVTHLCMYTSNEAEESTVTASLTGTSGSWTVDFAAAKAVYYTNAFESPLVTTLNTANPTLKITVNNMKSGGQAYFDWALLSYQATLPKDSDPVNDVVVGAGTSGGQLCLATPEGYTDARAWDIDNPQTPRSIPVSDGKYYIDCAKGGSRVTLFDGSQSLKQIGEWSEVPATDLHYLYNERPQMLIITTDEFYSKALELAAVHSRTDGVRVSVAKIEDIYNEYSSGIPDIMAYRTLVKNMRVRMGTQLENVLLFGPLSSDVRGVSRGEPYESKNMIIAHQSPLSAITGDTHNINDFICVTSDVVGAVPDTHNIDIGIGILPVRSEFDASLIIDKIERYLTDTDHARIANRVVGASGCGDQYLHTNQMSDMIKRWQDYTLDRVIVTPLQFDNFPPPTAVKEVVESLNAGSLFWMYMGHSCASSINNPPSLLKSDLINLNNQDLTFMLFGSCDVSVPDHQERGLGEAIVMDVPHGAIGALLTTRTAWSSHNETMLRNFMQALIYETGTTRRTTNLSLGKAFAAAKTQMRTQHEHTFQLIADPSLKLPVPLLTAEPENLTDKAAPGAAIRVSGKILNPRNQHVSEYNGEMLVTLLAPLVIITSRDFQTANGTGAGQYPIKLQNNVLSTARIEVKDGVFDGKIIVPADANLRDGDVVTLKLCAYNPDTRVVAAQSVEVTVDRASIAEEQKVTDTEAPVIHRFEYAAGNMEIELSDESGVAIENGSLLPGTTLSLDGKNLGRLDDDVQWLSHDPVRVALSIPVTLGKGEHSALLTTSDYFGNTRQQSLSFQVGEPEKYALEGRRIFEGTAEFRLQGGDTASSGHLVISTLDGYTLSRTPFEGTVMRADISQLTPGVYHASVITETGSSAPFSFSVVVPR